MKQFRTIVLAAVTAALCIPGAASAAIPAGNTGWSWSNPLPQGNTLDSVAVSGGRVWAGGATGTLLHSDDAGASWIAVRTGLLDDIRTIEAISPNSLVFAGRCALRRTDDGGLTVRRLAWGSSDDNCPATIQAVSFPSPLIGYLLLSNGDVYSTGDGGDSWKKQGVAPGAVATGGTEAVRDIHFNNLSTGVLSIGGRILQTADAGQTWTPVKTVGATALFNFEFIDANIGYAVGDHTDMLKTVDGGLTWNAVAPSDDAPRAQDLRSIECLDQSTCLATLASSNTLLRTSDGGSTWAAVTAGTGPVFAVGFLGGPNVVGVGQDGGTVVSRDAGATWLPVNSVASGRFRGLRALGARDTLIFGDAGALARSTDGGGSWRSLNLPTGRTVLDAAAIGANRLFAVDDGGAFFRSTDAGASWSAAARSGAKPARALLAFKPKTVVRIGPKGLSRSTRAGAGFKAARGAVARLTLTAADTAGKSAAFVYGPRAVALTRDKGATWRIVPRPRGASSIVRLEMLDARNGYLLDSNAELYATRNGGRRWTRLETTGANVAVSMAFGDLKHGYLTDNTGRVLATSDRGATWVRQYPFYDSAAASSSLVVAPGKLSALTLVQGTNRVFASSTGGRIGRSSLLTIQPSATRVRKGSLVRVTGTLSPATGIERVTVLARVANAKGGTRWTSLERTVSATGTFTTTWKITAATEFIARWSGDASHDGDAAPLKLVKLRR